MAFIERCSRVLVAAAAGVLLAGAGSFAAGETYKIVDEQGRVQYTDRIPPEAVNRGMVELNKQGQPKKVTEPAMTPEQRKAWEASEERRLQAERALAEKKHQENALLASYTNENDIDVAKKRNLAIVGAAILGAEARIKALQRRTQLLEKEKQYYENKPIPDKLRRDIAAVTNEIPKLQAFIAEKNEEALAVDTKYNKLKLQFRELKSQMTRETQLVRKQ